MEIIFSDQKTIQGVDTIMIYNLIEEHAYGEIDPLLNALFQYIDRLSFLDTPYTTGRPPISKRALLKCVFLKSYFAIDSLRELVRTLQQFGYFRRICGLSDVPHVSTFSRVSQWFQEQGFSEFHAQLLLDVSVKQPSVVLIDSTALRSSLYDSQKWGLSTRYHCFKGYKLHLCTTIEGIILSHVLTSVHRNDAVVAPELLSSGWDIEFALGDATYDRNRSVKQPSDWISFSFP